MEGWFLPVTAVSVVEVDETLNRAASVAVTTAGPASVVVEDEDEWPPWEEMGADGMTSTVRDTAVWVSGLVEGGRASSVHQWNLD